MFHWLDHQFWFNEGSNYWQWITSFVAITGWSLAAWVFWHHRCGEPLCVRPGQVPIKGSHHKICKKHAVQKGVTH